MPVTATTVPVTVIVAAVMTTTMVSVAMIAMGLAAMRLAAVGFATSMAFAAVSMTSVTDLDQQRIRHRAHRVGADRSSRGR